MSNSIPEGYVPFAVLDGYIAHNGPYYVKSLDDGTYTYGFQADERHTNPNNVLHGAALIGFADTVLGRIIFLSLGRNCATISLTTEFVAGAPWGSWVEATARIKRATKSMAFVDTDVTVAGELVLSATGVYKLFGER